MVHGVDSTATISHEAVHIASTGSGARIIHLTGR